MNGCWRWLRPRTTSVKWRLVRKGREMPFASAEEPSARRSQSSQLELAARMRSRRGRAKRAGGPNPTAGRARRRTDPPLKLDRSELRAERRTQWEGREPSPKAVPRGRVRDFLGAVPVGPFPVGIVGPWRSPTAAKAASRTNSLPRRGERNLPVSAATGACSRPRAFAAGESAARRPTSGRHPEAAVPAARKRDARRGALGPPRDGLGATDESPSGVRGRGDATVRGAQPAAQRPSSGARGRGWAEGGPCKVPTGPAGGIPRPSGRAPRWSGRPRAAGAQHRHARRSSSSPGAHGRTGPHRQTR